mgnify:FL=1
MNADRLRRLLTKARTWELEQGDFEDLVVALQDPAVVSEVRARWPDIDVPRLDHRPALAEGPQPLTWLGSVR